MEKHTTTAATAFFVLALTVGMASTATAVSSDDNETTTVNVTVSSTTALDVKPDSLIYPSASVGDRVTQDTNGFGVLQIENTGSQDIDRIWMNTTTPNSNPFGTGDETNHDAANMFQLKNPTDDSTGIRGDNETYHFVQRVEFFEDSSPLITTGDSWADADSDTIDVGRIRLGNDEFYFALGYTSNCDGSGQSELRVAKNATTPESLGTYDFSDGNSDEWVNYSIAQVSNTNYGITDRGDQGVVLNVTDDSGNVAEQHEYDILTACTAADGDLASEPHIVVNRYNVGVGTSNNLYDNEGTVTNHIYRSGGGDYLNPGEHFASDVAVQIPRGVPQGDLTQGTLTVFSQAR